MSDDGEFTPRLGRMRNRGGGKRARRYLSTVVAAAARSAEKGEIRSRRFDGSRIGRGASMGRLLSSRDRLAAFRARRAVVKTRLVRLGGKGLSAARAHLRYIQRDGVTREGAPGELYSAEHARADGKAFLERSAGDRHQFRFIVSAEDGSEYPDLKPYIRRLMTQMEADLGTRLDWVAVDHFNTAHPHTHIMLRGVDDLGQNLVIAREYISHGIRTRAAELATLDLGPRTDQEIEARLRHDIGEERVTAIDRRLIQAMDSDRVVSSADSDPFQQSLRAGRLQKLASLGLADNLGGGRWQLAEDLEATLKAMSERGDIIRTMQRELTARKLERPWLGRSVFGAGDAAVEPIVGRIIARGFADEHNDRHFLLVDGVDGHAHYIDIGRGDATGPLAEGSIVEVRARSLEVRDADRVVAEVAAANAGRYSVDLHLRHDPTATQAFAEAHVRRLEAMRRAGAGVEREPDGSWTIAADHLDRAASYEARRYRDQPAEVVILSAAPLEQLRDADAATWVDRELASGDAQPIRDAGFGREVRSALAARRQWLVKHGLADSDGDRVRLRANALAALRRRELLRVGGQLSGELGKAFAEARPGDAIGGRLTRQIDLISGRFALVEKSREFTLVPWRPVLERQVGNQVGGIMRADGVNWQFGRGRAGPEIT
ncbi:relaxase/mobilization nuclease RlxS [Sphingomonas sp. KR3-1]|uniref:relaxase/mobilization nuclease RlxS n=1 Tax=Sphingomonas sp. KR3-1 TaxID=3156611 RepID=UPI0032B48115